MANLLIGRSGTLALYANDSVGVVIDTSLGMIVNSGASLSLFNSAKWEPSKLPLNASETLLGDRALDNFIEDSLIASADRMFTIPKSVQAEAEKALAWRKEHKRGGTSVGLNTARTLAKGGQVGLRKVRHIAKYFPRHEVDKKGKGWAPGEDGFPSNGRIAWALWGGDAGRRWASAIVEREEKSVTAGAYGFVKPELTPFQEAHMLDENYGPEFLARVDLDGSGIDRLYKIDIDGRVYVWDDECWDDLGSVDGDIWTYDKALDDPYSKSEKTHVIIDPSSALLIAARLSVNPDMPVSVYDIDRDEAALVSLGLTEEDVDLIDMAMTAAGATSAKPVKMTDRDGNYTPEERSANAKAQPRNALGNFASVNQRVSVGGDGEQGTGTILSLDNKTGLADVKLDNGKLVTVGIKYTKPVEEAPVEEPADATPVKKLDTSGILGETRQDKKEPKAILSEKRTPLTPEEIKEMLYKWAESVVKYRAKKGLTAAAEEKPELTPKTSDVPVKYVAIVAQEAPDAVVDLVAIVPKTLTTTTPATYKREDGKWVYDEQIYNDLTSATPPPMLELDKESVTDVISQMDETNTDAPEMKSVAASAIVESIDQVFLSFFNSTSITAAGGLDRNRGNAEALRRYWTRGEGAAKIRWGTPGDWKRCVRYLSKHLGPRAKGYCQLRHKDALGYYTATHAKRDRNNG